MLAVVVFALNAQGSSPYKLVSSRDPVADYARVITNSFSLGVKSRVKRPRAAALFQLLQFTCPLLTIGMAIATLLLPGEEGSQVSKKTAGAAKALKQAVDVVAVPSGISNENSTRSSPSLRLNQFWIRLKSTPLALYITHLQLSRERPNLQSFRPTWLTDGKQLCRRLSEVRSPDKRTPKSDILRRSSLRTSPSTRMSWCPPQPRESVQSVVSMSIPLAVCRESGLVISSPGKMITALHLITGVGASGAQVLPDLVAGEQLSTFG